MNTSTSGTSTSGTAHGAPHPAVARRRHPAALGTRHDGERRTPVIHRVRDDEDGSLVTEYGLLAVVGATTASLVIKWATGGAVYELFGALTQKVRVMLGA